MDDVMTRLFSLGSLGVLPFWALMIFAPRWRVTARAVASPLIAAVPIALYAALVAPRLAVLAPLLARPELPPLAAILGTPQGTTIAWFHFLALDLLAGRAIFQHAREQGLSSWLVSPVLVLTLMFAPLGIAGYAGVLAARSGLVRRAARAIWDGHRALAVVAVGGLGLLVFSLVAELFDAREIVGVPAWLKPAKFSASVVMMAASVAWILGQMTGERVRRLVLAGRIMAGVATLELVLITIQTARGVPSHFNFRTPIDSLIFSVMGLAITILWLAQLYIGIDTFRQRFVTDARTWAIRLGLAGSLLGGALGFAMTGPTPAQRAELQAGHKPAAVGGHAVGVPDGGPGLPVTRWSTTGGDLRVPHFLGLHALQVLPLAALVLERRRRGGRAVAALGAGWLAAVFATFVQALRGQPVLAPDATTWTFAMVAAAVTAVIALWPAPREARPLVAASEARR